MSDEIRIGLVGLDTSHVDTLAGKLNDPNHPDHLPGAKVVAGYPGGSEDFELSISRVEGFTKKLRDELGVEILDSPEAVAEKVDLLYITAVDGRVHRELFERTVPFGRPTFIDKPFACSLDDARAIIKTAQDAKVPVMSASSLRYSNNLRAALEDDSGGAILGCHVFGPMWHQPTQPGLFWYGVHTVDMLVATMGTGFRRVRATETKDFTLVVVEYDDGRLASIRGTRPGHPIFGAIVHREKDTRMVDASAGGNCLTQAILASLPKGRSDVPNEEMIEVIALIAAANESIETHKPVDRKD